MVIFYKKNYFIVFIIKRESYHSCCYCFNYDCSCDGALMTPRKISKRSMQVSGLRAASMLL